MADADADLFAGVPDVVAPPAGVDPVVDAAAEAATAPCPVCKAVTAHGGSRLWAATRWARGGAIREHEVLNGCVV